MPQLLIDSLHSDFGARVTGVNLTEALSQAVIEEIHNAIDTYSFLCFPNQTMTDDTQLAFTKCLGKPEEEHVHYGKTGEKNLSGDGRQCHRRQDQNGQCHGPLALPERQ